MCGNKTEICLITSFVAIITFFCLSKKYELDELVCRKNELIEQKNNVKKLSDEISAESFDLPESSEKLFAKAIDVKETIKKISQESLAQNVRFKKEYESKKYFDIENVEMKFSANDEKSVYDFLHNFRNNTNGVTVFDSVRISAEKQQKFAAEIQCSIFTFRDGREFFTVSPRKKHSSLPISIFPRKKQKVKHTLLCVADGTAAYIDDRWMTVSESDPDFKIQKIYPDSADILKDNKVVNVKVGASW